MRVATREELVFRRILILFYILSEVNLRSFKTMDSPSSQRLVHGLLTAAALTPSLLQQAVN